MQFRFRILITSFFCLAFVLPALSQNPNLLISYTTSDSLFVCGTDTFTIRIQNNGGDLSSGAALTFALPNGIHYVSGSATGANQQNISNLQSPIFSLPAIPANNTAVVKLLLEGNCQAADILDAGGLFTAGISINSPETNASITTTSIPLETGLLLIESVDDVLMEGEKFDTLLRTICVKNTRLGKISNLYFEDSHQPGFEVSIANAAQQSNTTVFFRADFSNALFQNTGNHDTWLDIGEKVCFTEKIVITDCGTPELLSSSILRVGWGCGTEHCRYDSALATIRIKPSTKVPDLVFTPIWNPPTDNCGQTGALLGLDINNIGTDDAENVSIKLSISLLPDKMAMKPGSYRIVNSSGVSTNLPPNLTASNADFTCNPQAHQDAWLTIPVVKSKDSLQLLFEVINCIDACEQRMPVIYVEIFYRKDCPENGFVSDTMQITSDGAYNITSSLVMGIGGCMESGKKYPFVYKVRSKRLVESSGFLHIEMDLPPGVNLDTTCLGTLGGATPVQTSITTTPDQVTHFESVYALPLPSASQQMNLCMVYTCDTSFNYNCLPPVMDDSIQVVYVANCYYCLSPLFQRTYWTPALNTPYDCSLGDCQEYRLVLDAGCLLDTFSNIPPLGPGGLGLPDSVIYNWKIDVQRTNYGFKDSNDNRLADNGSIAPANEIRTDRFLAGDTLRISYCGSISSGLLDYLPRYIYHEVLKSDFGSFDNDEIDLDKARKNFVDATRFKYLRDSIKIRYADGQTVSFALDDLVSSDDMNRFLLAAPNTYPPAALDDIASERFFFYVNFAELYQAGFLPKSLIGVGDTVFFYTYYKVGMNYNFPKIGSTDPPLIGFQTAVNHSGWAFNWNFGVSKKLQYSGFRQDATANTFSIKPCEPSVEAKKFSYSIRIARGNMFPKEVRPLGVIADYLLTVPEELALQSATLTDLTLQENPTTLTNLALPYTQSSGLIDIDFNPAFAEPVDEGFRLNTSVVFEPDCMYAYPDSSIQWITTLYHGCLNGDTMVSTRKIKNQIGYFTNHPELTIISLDSVVNSPTKPFEFLFNIKNPVVSQAPHAWISIQSLSGLASSFNLYKLPQNQAITPANGIYNIGAVNGFSQIPFKITGNEISCQTDTLMIIYGWDCSVIGNLSESMCYRDTYLLYLNLEKPELELNVLEEPENITLCDTSDYFVFEIFNAKTGYAYDLFGSARLPQGMRVISGTSQIFYPPTGAWVDISDPEQVPGNIFRWDVSAAQPTIGATGLPGVQLAPQNTVRIRFKVAAECGFVANTPIIYGTYGKEPCGRSTNVLNKPGEPINIEGLTASYGVQVAIQPAGNEPAVCGSEQEFVAQLGILGTPSSGDSIVVLLPAGASLAPGSYVPGLNAPAGPPVITPEGFRLPMPLLNGGGNVNFRFRVVYGPGSGCTDQLLTVQTRVHTEAYCQTLGAPCEVYISTGEATISLQVQHPELSMSDAGINIYQNNAGASVQLNNIGSYTANGGSAHIWYDADGNNAVSAGDSLLLTLSSDQEISPGGSVNLSGDFVYQPEYQCHLLLSLSAAENCLCEDQVIPINRLSIQYDTLFICTLEADSIGIAGQPGYEYQWQPSTGLSCSTCPEALYTPDPNTLPGSSVSLTLEASSGDCKVSHVFHLTFGTTATVTVNNATVCLGGSVTLSVEPPGQTYNWQGPGIQDSSAQIQQLIPTATSEYLVTVYSANGCTATASVTVNVSPTDTIVLPVITACEGSSVTVFNEEITASNEVFHQSLTNAAGCDSTIIQEVVVLPLKHTEESIQFCEGQTQPVFDTVLTESGMVCRTFTSSNNCDSTHCITATMNPAPDLPEQDTIFAQFGQAITLEGESGYVQYTWEPAPSPACDNCNVIEVKPDSTGLFEYILTVKDANGCSDQIVWRVFIWPPCGPETVMIPNAFTPNSDGANDVFRPIASESGELFGKLIIYDRWGEKVYENTGDVFWDGTIDGEPGPSDVYVYIIEVICVDGPHYKSGEVNLLR